MSRRNLLILLFLWPFLAAAFAVLIRPGIIVSGALFFGVPATLLAIRSPRYLGKALMFALLVSVVLGVPFEYIIESMREYVIPSSAFGDFRVFGLVTVDAVTWMAFWTAFVVLFYESLSNRGRGLVFQRRQMRTLVGILAAWFALFVMLYYLNPDLLRIERFYLKFSIIALVVPLAFILYRHPALRPKIGLTALYFVIVNALADVTSVHLGHWFFPAESAVLGHILLGPYRFSYEEVLFFFIMSAPVVVAYYEYFDDDRR